MTKRHSDILHKRMDTTEMRRGGGGDERRWTEERGRSGEGKAGREGTDS